MLLGAAAVLVVVLGSQWRAAIRRNRSVPDEPFRIAGNLYHVGATGVTAFLLTGPEGHVLIDGGYPETDAGDPADPFIDRDGYLRYIDYAERRFRERLAEQQPGA